MELSCQFSHFESVFTDQVIYMCQITDIRRIGSNGRVLNIHGEHIDGKSNADVHTLTIVDHQIENFPRYLCNYFPNLKSISIISCGLRHLSKHDFIGCEGIEKLILNGNMISTLPADVFDYIQNLETISFFRNQLEFVDLNAFSGLKKLKSLNLKMNLKSDWSCTQDKHMKFSLNDLKTNIAISFGNCRMKVYRKMELIETFWFLKNYRDSVKIATKDDFNYRINMVVRRLESEICPF